MDSAKHLFRSTLFPPHILVFPGRFVREKIRLDPLSVSEHKCAPVKSSFPPSVSSRKLRQRRPNFPFPPVRCLNCYLESVLHCLSFVCTLLYVGSAWGEAGPKRRMTQLDEEHDDRGQKKGAAMHVLQKEEKQIGQKFLSPLYIS